MAYFSDAEVGDKVFDYLKQEWGNVVRIFKDDSHQLRVVYRDSFDYYTIEGKLHMYDEVQVLFWDEVKPVTPPDKPFEYPMWFKLKTYNAIVKFTGLTNGIVVVPDACLPYPVGYGDDNLTPHTDKNTWEQVEEPTDPSSILEFEDIAVKEEELSNKTYSFKEAIFKLIQLQELELQELHHYAAKTDLPVWKAKHYAERIDKPTEAYRFKLGRTKTNPLKEYDSNKNFLIAPDDVFATWTIKTIKEN
jgi:hypothetical protein